MSTETLGEHVIKTTLFRMIWCRKNNKVPSHISSLFFAFIVVYHSVSSRHHAQAFQNIDAFQRPTFHQMFLFENFSFQKANYWEFQLYTLHRWHAAFRDFYLPCMTRASDDQRNKSIFNASIYLLCIRMWEVVNVVRLYFTSH